MTEIKKITIEDARQALERLYPGQVWHVQVVHQYFEILKHHGSLTTAVRRSDGAVGTLRRVMQVGFYCDFQEGDRS